MYLIILCYIHFVYLFTFQTNFKICIKVDFTLKCYYYVFCAFVTYISITNSIVIVCRSITNPI